VVELRRNFGQTPALAAGFDHARGDVVISMDGDLQHAPDEIPTFLAAIAEGYDLVSGWRERREKTDSVSRTLPSLVANKLMAWLSGVQLHDFGTTFKAYRRDLLQGVELFGELHRFVPALASAYGARIKEIPIKSLPRKSGKSKYNIKRTFRVLCDIITVKFLISYLTSPLRVFGFLGLTSFGAGLAIGLGLMFNYLFLGGGSPREQHGALLLFSVFLMITGVQFVTVGLTAEIAARTYHRAAGKTIYAVRRVLGPPRQPGGD
jgi:glycosyltransferase involved in cell wall biosynthesis